MDAYWFKKFNIVLEELVEKQELIENEVDDDNDNEVENTDVENVDNYVLKVFFKDQKRNRNKMLTDNVNVNVSTKTILLFWILYLLFR